MSELSVAENTGELEERLELSYGRLQEILREESVDEPFRSYFRETASFLLKPSYEAALPERYGDSWLNPAFAAARLGKETGQILSAAAYELLGVIPLHAEERLEEVAVLREVFLQLYGVFEIACELGEVPDPAALKGIWYAFISDYADLTLGEHVCAQLDPSRDFARKIVMESDLSDPAYLDRYGEYVTEDTRELSRFLWSLSEEEIGKMADAFTEGFRIGFLNTGKDLSKKKTVELRFHIGFERLVRREIENFEKMGLSCTIRRRALHAATRSSVEYSGFYGDHVNRQMDYDHREDSALFLDKAFVNRKLEVLRAVYTRMKEEALLFAGPAVMETFGEPPFLPGQCPEALTLSDEGRELAVVLAGETGTLVNEFIPGEERSFTIISWPVPAIGPEFFAIFRETVGLNTLDYARYRDLQQKLIETLEQGEKAEIIGKNGNRTRLTVMFPALPDPEKETIFENCVADVNIPVGEVFTSPRLSGTEGVLFVSEVYLNGLRFENLELTFQDGFVTDYGCTNFSDPKENRRYIEEHVLFHHPSLPLGEFAIGTNTTAYAAAKKYGIFSLLPILIAEKTGPHFALGDTCYSRAEDVRVFNPDGREIISRDNEVTIRRKENPDFRYYECHTDVTIPYEELGSITVIGKNGERWPVIEDGRFAVEGTEILNEPLTKLAACPTC